jgi:hypothetical protein
MKRLAAALVLVFSYSAPSLAQQGTVTVTRNVNLRPTPSTTQQAIQLLTPPATLTLVDPTPTNGFYHVTTAQGQDGWVWTKNVSVNTSGRIVSPLGVPPGGGAPPGFLVSAGTFHNCGLAGSARSTSVRALNQLKNRFTAPASVNPSVTASALMAPGNDTGRFSVTDAATIRLFVTYAKPGGTETVNCGATQVQWKDTHIEGDSVGPQYHGLPMIVEVTPRWRAAENGVGIDWSTQTLHDTLVGHWVEVTGWLFFDSEHTNAAMNTNPQGAGRMCGNHACLWRETVWELHPVTNIRIVNGPS